MRAARNRGGLLLPAVMLVLAAPAYGASGGPEARAHPACPGTGQVYVPAGRYKPFYKSSGNREIPVAPMCLDTRPVTNAQFQEFVRTHPEWRRSQVDRIFAEPNYLAHWHDDLSAPEDSLSAPVIQISWFAAGAYCEAQGGRLPTVREWERFGGARAPALALPGAGADAQRPAADATPFAFAMGERAPDLAASPLVLAQIWEWTEDFNSALVSGRASGQEGDSTQFCGDGYRAVDATDYAAFLRYSFRSSLRADFALRNLGFRCTRDAR
jgi:sulfatase modifying factor 1